MASLARQSGVYVCDVRYVAIPLLGAPLCVLRPMSIEAVRTVVLKIIHAEWSYLKPRSEALTGVKGQGETRSSANEGRTLQSGRQLASHQQP